MQNNRSQEQPASDTQPSWSTRRRRSNALWSLGFLLAAVIFGAFGVLHWSSNTTVRPDRGYVVEMMGRCGVHVSASKHGSDPTWISTDTGLKDANDRKSCKRFVVGETVTYNADDDGISPMSTRASDRLFDTPRLTALALIAVSLFCVGASVLFVWDLLPAAITRRSKKRSRHLP